MNLKNRDINAIKQQLLSKLKDERAFWSYASDSITLENIEDKMLIALTMRYLDIAEIELLYKIYPQSKIKEAWKDIMVPEGDYLYTLNRFFAWYYFKAKHPDSYLKFLQTRYQNRNFS